MLWYCFHMSPDHQNATDTPRQWDTGPIVALLSLVWFVGGMLLFGCFALFAFMLNPFATDNVFEPENYRLAVMVWHLPMAFGWVPAAYRAARKRERPWRHAKTTIIFGMFLGPFLFLAVMLVWRWYAQASASI